MIRFLIRSINFNYAFFRCAFVYERARVYERECECALYLFNFLSFVRSFAYFVFLCFTFLSVSLTVFFRFICFFHTHTQKTLIIFTKRNPLVCFAQPHKRLQIGVSVSRFFLS